MGMTGKKRVRSWIPDTCFLAGCAVFVYGVWLAWRPLGFIVGGLAVAAIAFFMGYRPAGGEEE
jgi:hypothetical protein